MVLPRIPPKLAASYSAIVLISITVGALILNYTLGILPNKAVWMASGLAAVAILATALFGHFKTEDIIKEVQASIVAGVTPFIDAQFQKLEKTTEKLARTQERLEGTIACLPGTPISEALMTSAQIEDIEKHVKKKVLVVTSNLDFDKDIVQTVKDNLKRGVLYTYLMPNDPGKPDEAKSFKNEHGDCDGQLTFVFTDAFHFPTDLVIYDHDHPVHRTGYLCLPLPRSQPHAQHPDQPHVDKHPKAVKMDSFVLQLATYRVTKLLEIEMKPKTQGTVG